MRLFLLLLGLTVPCVFGSRCCFPDHFRAKISDQQKDTLLLIFVDFVSNKFVINAKKGNVDHLRWIVGDLTLNKSYTFYKDFSCLIEPLQVQYKLRKCISDQAVAGTSISHHGSVGDGIATHYKEPEYTIQVLLKDDNKGCYPLVREAQNGGTNFTHHFSDFSGEQDKLPLFTPDLSRCVDRNGAVVG